MVFIGIKKAYLVTAGVWVCMPERDVIGSLVEYIAREKNERGIEIEMQVKRRRRRPKKTWMNNARQNMNLYFNMLYS